MLLRVSYSVLNMWARGDYDGAIQAYLGNWPEPTEAMLKGRELHKKWELEVQQTGCLPEVFGGRKLVNPLVETKHTKKLGDWIQLVGRLDLSEDNKVGTDFKSGVTPAGAYTTSFQHKVYKLLIPTLERFEYLSYNPYNEEVNCAIVHLTDKDIEDGAEYVVTYASEMRDYLEENNLIREPGSYASAK